jgi:hypothetical protein
MNTLMALLREYGMGSDHERHVLCAAHANRVSDTAGVAAFPDPKLINPWGLY